MSGADTIAIVGCGAIGSLIAARLAAAGRPVAALARGAHLTAMRAQGLRLTADDGTDTLHRLAVTDRMDRLPDAGVILITLKAHHLAPFALELAERAARGAALVFAQNGIPWWYPRGIPALAGLPPGAVDPEGALPGAMEDLPVMGGVLYMIASLRAPGWVHEVPMQGKRLLVGAADHNHNQSRAAAVAAALDVPGNPTKVDTEIRRTVWAKLLGNIALNPLCMLTGVPVDRLMADPEAARMVEALMHEAADIAGAAGIPGLQDGIPPRLAAFRERPGVKPSMLQDAELGRAMEIGPILGAPLALAQRLGVPAPLLAQIHALAALRAQTLGPKEP